MSARDELGELISSRHTMAAADAILAAGYSKPRMITTAEELDALPDDSVVLDEMDGPLTKVGDWWHSPSDEMRSHSAIIPATVLYTPKES
jgi:hypothetical protein